MATKKNALMLFCKPPIPGLVKTRLTEANGGSLTNEEAAEFFGCSLLDVTELALLALDDLDELNFAERAHDKNITEKSYDFFISTISQEAITLLQAFIAADGPWTRSIEFLVDKGTSFDEHFDDAFTQLFSRGYQAVVSIGADMPLLPRGHIVEAFCWLDELRKTNDEGFAFVQAPCQQSGVSLVGMTKGTPLTASGVYYNRSGLPALDAYTAKLREVDVPNIFLHPVSDVDDDADLAHMISCLNAVAEASFYQPDIFLARRVLAWVDHMGLVVTAPPNDEHDPRQYIDVAEYK